MPCMEGTHGRDEACRAPFRARLAGHLLHPFDGVDGFQEDWQRGLQPVGFGPRKDSPPQVEARATKSRAGRRCLLAIEHDQIRGDRLRTELPQHRDHLPAMIARVVRQLMQALPQRI